MLEMLRRAVRSWVAKALLALLVVSFAIWGVGDISQGFSTNVATVGERTIGAETYARVLRSQATRFGVDPSQFRDTGLDRYVLASLVREAAFEEAAREMGVSAPDSAVARQVRNDPSFRIAGEFDPAQYESSVRRIWGSVADYEDSVRRAVAAAPLRAAVGGSANAPYRMAEAIARRASEQRRFAALSLTLGDDAVEAPSDAELEAHLEENAAAFRAPERRDVSYLHIDLAALAADIPVDEAGLRALYDDRADIYAQPETRVIEQIVYESADAAAAARARLDSGEADFDALLAERGLTRADAALGAVTRDDIAGPRADAAFALDGPGIAGPAEIPTGAALLEVVEITPAIVTPFEEVRDALAAELGADAARPEADRLAEEVADLAAAGATLEEIGAELGLEIRTAEGVTAGGPAVGGDPLTASPPFTTEAFAAEQGQLRDLTDDPSGGYFMLRVDAVTPASTPPLANIREAVEASWRAERRAEALAERAQDIVARIEAGETLAAIAAEMDRETSSIGPLRRDDPDPRLDAAARETLFTGAPGAAAASVRGSRATVAVLEEIVAADAVREQAEAVRAALTQSVAQDQLEYFGRALEAEMGAVFNQQALDAVLSQIGG
jgi:peptidyl-prolyl cis-trans isomerase D